MRKQERRKLIRTKIEAGATQQEVYDELHGPWNKADEQLADLVRDVPSVERRAQCRTGHFVLMGLLVLVIVWKLALVLPAEVQRGWFAGSFHAVILVGLSVVLFAVANYWRRAHAFAGFLGFLQLMHLHNHQVNTEWFDLALILLYGSIAVLGMNMQRQLTPDYIKLKERYQNAEGQERLREVVRFGD